MKRLFALLLALLLATACIACRQATPPDPTDGTQPRPTDPTEPSETFPVDVPFTPIGSVKDYFQYALYAPPVGLDNIQYLFHEPIRATGKAYPLIIYLHGKGEALSLQNIGSASQLVNNLIALENSMEAYSAYTLVPITPHGSEGQWKAWQIDYLIKLIGELIENHNIDPKRVYITGLSMGGYATCQLVNEMPTTFAAAVPLSGARQMVHPLHIKNTAFRIYHAANDPVVNVTCSRDLYQQLLLYQHPKAEYFETPVGSHTSTLSTAYGDPHFYIWLFNQRRP